MSGKGFDRPEKPKKGAPITVVDNITFNDVTTTYTSAVVDALQFRKFILMVHKTVAGAPTTMEVRVQYSPDNVNWFNFTRGPFGYLAWEDTAGTEDEAIDGDVPTRYLRVYCVAVGTTAVLTFTLTVRIQLMS
jgi:hypothetical protein